MEKINIFWFRRDLRLEDNTGLHHALKSGLKIMPVFIFDTEILDQLQNKSDKRVDYIQQALVSLHRDLVTLKSGLTVYHGKPLDVFKRLTEEFDIDAVFCNRDYEPQAIKRDQQVKDFLHKRYWFFRL